MSPVVPSVIYWIRSRNQESPPEGTEAVIVTDKSLNIDQQAAVSNMFTWHEFVSISYLGVLFLSR